MYKPVERVPVSVDRHFAVFPSTYHRTEITDPPFRDRYSRRFTAARGPRYKQCMSCLAYCTDDGDCLTLLLQQWEIHLSRPRGSNRLRKRERWLDVLGTVPQSIDMHALDGAIIHDIWNGAGPHDDKLAGSAPEVGVGQDLAQAFFTHHAFILKQDFIAAGGGSLPKPPNNYRQRDQRCVHCMECFNPAENGALACAVPHAAPIHTPIAGDEALSQAIHPPCCDTGRLNIPGLHPPP